MDTDHRVRQVLLVEDSGTDARLLSFWLSSCPVPLHVTVLSDGEQALARLRSEVDTHGVSSFDLILLDVNLPGRSGLEIFAEIRADSRLCALPLLIFAEALDSRLSSTNLRPVHYQSKPIAAEEYQALVRTVHCLLCPPPVAALAESAS